MTDPNETDLHTNRQVEGTSGISYEEKIVPDDVKGGFTTEVVPPVAEDGTIFVQPGQGE